MSEQSKDILQLARDAKALADKATPGPWQRWIIKPYWIISQDGHNIANLGDETCSKDEYNANAEFLTASRETVPDLADAVLALSAKLEAVKVELADRNMFIKATLETLSTTNAELQQAREVFGKLIEANRFFRMVYAEELTATDGTHFQRGLDIPKRVVREIQAVLAACDALTPPDQE
jgi:hypothetical protein